MLVQANKKTAELTLLLPVQPFFQEEFLEKITTEDYHLMIIR